MSCNTQNSNHRPRLTSLGIAILIGIITVACSGDPEPTAVDDPANAENVVIFIARSEAPGDKILQELIPDEHHTMRELEFLLLLNSADKHKMDPLDTIADQAYIDSQIGAGYSNHLLMDLTAADNLCESVPDSHCLVVIATYDPCQPQTGCSYHSISEITMMKTYGKWAGIFINNFNPAIDEQVFDGYLEQILDPYLEASYYETHDMHTRANEAHTESDLEIRHELELALTRQSELMFEPLDNETTDSPYDPEEVGQILFDTVFYMYEAAVANLPG